MAARRLDSLTGLRFFAALLVFFHHSFSSSIVSHGLARVPGTPKFALAGMSGVTFFFVLSGFVLTWSWKDDQPKSGFLARRLSRIGPLHVLTFLVAGFLVLPLLGRPAITALETVVGVPLLQAWSTKPVYYFAGNGPAWSLSCELFFYALLPFLIPLLRRGTGRQAPWAVGLCFGFLVLVPFLLRLATHSTYALLDLWVFPGYRVGEFLIGVVAGWAMREGWRPRWSVPSALLLVVLAYGAAVAVFGSTFRTSNVSLRPLANVGTDFFVVLPVTALIVAVANADLRGGVRFLRSTFLIRLGAGSFAFYLVHSSLILIAAHLHHGTAFIRGVPLTALTLLVALAVADVLHTYVERPAELRLRGWIVAHERSAVT